MTRALLLLKSGHHLMEHRDAQERSLCTSIAGEEQVVCVANDHALEVGALDWIVPD